MADVVSTIVNTLPVCSVRKVAYATFSILEIKDSGEGYLAEFDNPFCIYIRDGAAHGVQVRNITNTPARACMKPAFRPCPAMSSPSSATA